MSSDHLNFSVNDNSNSEKTEAEAATIPESSESTNLDDVVTPKTPDLSNKFVLYVWPGEWGLATLDPECLTAMVYIFIFLIYFKSSDMTFL